MLSSAGGNGPGLPENRLTRGLVFSKDRAMQLDALLRSLGLYRSDDLPLELFVLYHTTSPEHAAQYEQLAAEYRTGAAGLSIHFVRQAEFYEDVYHVLLGEHYSPTALRYQRAIQRLPRRFRGLVDLWPLQAAARFVLFLVDDSLFVRPFSLEQIFASLEAAPPAAGFSLRLGRNTHFCYTLNQPQALPDFTPCLPGVLQYDWTASQYDFAYPLEVSSSVYRMEDVLRAIRRQPFSQPNALEDALASGARRFRRSRPLLLCYEQSAAFSIPANRVQAVKDNRAGLTYAYTEADLARRFAAGERIDLEAYRGFIPTGCHQEVELHFEQKHG